MSLGNGYGSLRRHRWAIPFEIVMLGGAVVTFAVGNWKHLAASLFTFAVSFVPLLVERLFRVKLSAIMQTVYVAFIFSSMFAGEVLGMYGHIWIWDDAVHGVSGLLIGAGVMFWLIFARLRKQFILPAWFEALTIFCVTTGIVVVWEIAEFASDQIFGTFSQGGDIHDTMMDLVYGLAGGLAMSIAWILYCKNKKVLGTSSLLAHFERINRESKAS